MGIKLKFFSVMVDISNEDMITALNKERLIT